MDGPREHSHAEDIEPLPAGILRPMYTSQGSPNNAQAVAVATPCWPAPVSAMIRLLPMRLANKACPMVLLILWAPVWAKSSRFKRMVAPPMTLDSWGHGVSGVARPT